MKEQVFNIWIGNTDLLGQYKEFKVIELNAPFSRFEKEKTNHVRIRREFKDRVEHYYP